MRNLDAARPLACGKHPVSIQRLSRAISIPTTLARVRNDVLQERDNGLHLLGRDLFESFEYVPSQSLMSSLERQMKDYRVGQIRP